MNNSKQPKTTDLPTLIGNLKNEDARYSRLSKNIQWIYWILIPIYAFMIIREMFDDGNAITLVSGICYILSMLIFALFFRKYQKEYREVNYDLPTLQMLKQAMYRYKPLQKKTLWILLAILLMDCGLSLSPIWENEDLKSVLTFQLIYFSTMIGSVCIGLVIWYYKYKPLYDEAKNLIAEIEN